MTDAEKDAEIERLTKLLQELETRNIELRAELTKLRRPRAPDA